MRKDIDITALGELLIDFTEAGQSEDGQKLFEQNPGGAPANLLTAASHMDCKTAFIGKVGRDMHGRYLKKTLEKEGIFTNGIVEDDHYFTTLAFVEVDDKGERSFSFARKPGADTMLQKEELNQSLLTDCRVFHFGSLSLTDEPSKTALWAAARIAKQSGALISYDPNYRSSLWKDPETAIHEIKQALPLADLLKVSEEESALLTGCSNYQEAAKQLLTTGPRFIAVTLGEKGVFLASAQKTEQIPGFLVPCVDTTGAGDSFWGGFLSTLLTLPKPLEQLDWEDLKKCAITGNAVAALCIQKRGGIPSIPEKEKVTAFLSNHI